jgi:hypothetical protein
MPLARILHLRKRCGATMRRAERQSVLDPNGDALELDLA